jgi:uncharacterized membrane protein
MMTGSATGTRLRFVGTWKIGWMCAQPLTWISWMGSFFSRINVLILAVARPCRRS